ncbi:hypothetical protein TNCV_3697961 [Trichonephila clavipes]|uniref:Uncharacterized protein n=1 Tax=Trichonephila clavipes TaxID=2585209 RepID=A0A8X6VJS4_TRICX|nr:hypothetical protein TNCV_3697961 [Trichonephila clavipes]
MQGAHASFKHGLQACARPSNFPVSSKRLTSFKRPAAINTLKNSQEAKNELKEETRRDQQEMQKGLENVLKSQGQELKNSLEKKIDNVEEKINSVEEKIAVKNGRKDSSS